MGQAFVDKKRVPVSVVKAGPCVVTYIKNEDKDGYWAVQVTVGKTKREIRENQEPTVKPGDQIKAGDQVFVIAGTGAAVRTRLYGKVDDAAATIVWQPMAATTAPTLAEPGLFADYPGSTLAARAFDTAKPGLGQWMVTLTVWLFALSTMITYGYYGEQGVVYLFGKAAVQPFRVIWVALILVTCSGIITTAEQIDELSTVTLGFMLAINLPMMIVLGPKAMRAYRDYFQRLEAGAIRR